MKPATALGRTILRPGRPENSGEITKARTVTITARGVSPNQDTPS
jgi:hypothetical protein